MLSVDMPILFVKYGEQALSNPDLLKIILPTKLIDFILVKQASKEFKIPPGRQRLAADRLWMEFAFEKTKVSFGVELIQLKDRYEVSSFQKIKDSTMSDVEARFAVRDSGELLIPKPPGSYPHSEATFQYRTKKMAEIVMSGVSMLNNKKVEKIERAVDCPVTLERKSEVLKGDRVRVVDLAATEKQYVTAYKNKMIGHTGQRRRYHLVRGHERRYRNGSSVWIPPHTRGDRNIGVSDVVYTFNL